MDVLHAENSSRGLKIDGLQIHSRLPIGGAVVVEPLGLEFIPGKGFRGELFQGHTDAQAPSDGLRHHIGSIGAISTFEFDVKLVHLILTIGRDAVFDHTWNAIEIFL